MKFIRFYIISIFITLVIMGCSSSGNGGNPLTPATSSADSTAYPYSDSDGVFGIYNLYLDASKMTAELTQIRNSSLGEVYQADITSFLGSLCSDCLQIVSVGMSDPDNFLQVKFRMHHPIPVPDDPFNPKPGDRLDLHLFDVRGIVITEGALSFPLLKSDVNGDGNKSEVIRCNPSLVPNADGYTTFFDSYMDASVVATNANLHPYKLFFKSPKEGNYKPDINPVNGWITTAYPQGQNVFPQGDNTNEVTYDFKVVPGSPLNLVMVIDACYGSSAKFAIQYPNVGSRMNPRYFLPEFHRKEAWNAYVDVTNNMLAHGDPNSSATISVTISDWQAGKTGQGSLNFITSTLNHVTATSDVRDVQLYVPDLMTDIVTTFISKAGSGTWLDPYIYYYTVNNGLDAVGGTYYGIVAIRDHLEGATNGPIGVDRNLGTIKITDFTNYQLFPLDVSAFPPNQMPVAIYTTDPINPMINSGEFVTFDATQSFDPDGEVILYEWDFEFEGLDFQVDATGATPPAHQYMNPDPSIPRLYFAILRVTDNGNPGLQGMYGSEVIVQPNSPPIAIINVDPSTAFSECDLVTLDGSASHDDTAITSYEWDFNYDPDYPTFNVDATGPIIERRFLPGVWNVMLRVNDDSVPPLSGVTRVRLVSQPLTGNLGEVAFCDNLILNEEDSLNSNSFAAGGLRNVILTNTGIVAALWVDEGDVSGGPAIKYSKSVDGGRTFQPPVNANSTLISGGIQDLRPCLINDFPGNLHLGYSDGDGKYYYQKSSASGSFGAPVEVGTGSRNNGGPALAVDGGGVIHYFFTGNTSMGNVPLKLAQSTNGGNSFDAPITLAADGKCPSAASLQLGSVAVAFEGKNPSISDNSDILISYQRSGSTFYPPIRVTDSSVNDGKSTNPSVAIAMSGAVNIVWQDSRLGDTDTDYDIYFAYSFIGLGFSQNVRVNNTSEHPGSQILQTSPTLGVDMMGNCYIAWIDYRDNSGGDLYFTNFLPGMPIMNNFKLNDDASSPAAVTQGPPSIVVSPNSGVLVIWGDERNAASDLGTPLSGPADIYYCFGKLF